MAPRARIVLRRLRLELVLGSWLALGCSDNSFPRPAVVWEGDFVRVRMEDPTVEVCGGSFEALDHHAALVREALLLEGDGTLNYSIVGPELAGEVCTGPEDERPSVACTHPLDGDVITSEPFLPHEIVHSVRVHDPQIAWRSSFFEEGLAMVYGGDYLHSYPRPLDVVGLLDREPDSALDYYYAGHTVARLIELHGVETFRRFDLQSRERGEEAAFSDVYGQTIEEFAAFVDAGTACEQTQWWHPLFECDGDPVVEDPQTGRLALSGELSCGAVDVVGPRFGRIWTSRHFRLDRPTSEIGYDIEMPEDSTLEVVRCGGGCPERFAYIGGRYDVGSILGRLPALQPGEYFLRMSRPAGTDDGYFEVVLHRS